MKERFTSTICVDILFKKKVKNDSFILLMKRQNTGFNDNEYELPGGHLEADEDLYDAAIREVNEELLVDLSRNDLRIIQVFHHYSENRVNFIFEVDGKGINPQIGEPDKCSELLWVNINDLPENVSNKFVRIIDNIINDNFYDSF